MPHEKRSGPGRRSTDVANLRAVNNISQETITALEKALDAAKSGEVVGIAFCLIKARRQVTVGLRGAAADHPEIALLGISRLKHLTEQEF